VPLAALLALGVGAELRRAARPRAGRGGRDADDAALPLARVLLGLLPIAGIVALAGAGGVGSPTSDWLKHNAVLRDLVEQPWPVAYRVSGETLGLVYYAGYYLPAALVGKLAGWAAANAVLFAATLGGALLLALWLVALVRGAPLLCGFLLAGFGGLDAVGRLSAFGLAKTAERVVAGANFEVWAYHWQYHGTASGFFWAPGQQLGAWLATALLIDAARSRDPRLPVCLLVAACALWSAFAALGLLALVWLPPALAPGAPRAAVRGQASLANLSGLLLGGVLFAWYAARALPYGLPEAYTTGIQVLPNGFLPALTPQDPRVWRTLALFCALEFGLLGALLLWIHAPLRRPRGASLLLLPALATLCVLPLFRYGHYNDLAMRTSLPALYVLLWLAAVGLRRRDAPRPARALLALGLALGALGGIAAVQKARVRVERRGSFVALPPRDSLPDLFQVHLDLRASGVGFDFAMQYLGSARAPFFRWLAPPGEPREITAHQGAAAAPPSGERGPQAPQVPEQPQGLRRQPARAQVALAAAPGAEHDRAPAHVAAPHQEQRERDVGQLEIRGQRAQRVLERVATHQAVGHVGIAGGDAGHQPGDEPQPEGDEHARGAVLAPPAPGEHRVHALARSPELREVARVALAVGVELEDPGRAAGERLAVARDAGGPVAGVGLVQHRELGQLGGERVEDRRRGVARSVVDGEQPEARSRATQGRDPLAHHGFDRLGLVVHRHDDEELQVHGGARPRAEPR
jgi:hypothetical protein